jgi:PIN domain nuclease of toxin-antitoxin system
MRLLLDTNILIGLTPDRRQSLASRITDQVRSGDNVCFASVVSLWEIAIKRRLKKLDTTMTATGIADYFESGGVAMLPVTREHVLAEVEPELSTRDPFDRLLIAICQVEGLRLVTLDRTLAAHPLAWR